MICTSINLFLSTSKTTKFCGVKSVHYYIIYQLLCCYFYTLYCVYMCIITGEGIAGALHYKELVQLTAKAGFAPPILVTSELYSVNNPEIQTMLGTTYNVLVSL